MRVAGAHALVTGGASGLGRGTVEHLRALGATVSVVDLAPSDEPDHHACDVADGGAMEAAFAAAVRAHGAPRIVVACAGVARTGPVLRRDGVVSIDEWQRTIEVNLVGTFNALRLAAFHLGDVEPFDDGERGVLVTTSSIAAEEGQEGQSAYVASKAGIASMTLPLARELGDRGIRVASIEPGVFETPMTLGLPEKSRDVVFGMRAPFPKRPGRPRDFALLVQSIVENPMLNGVTIRLDGALRLPPR